MKVVSLDYPLSEIVKDLEKEEILVAKDENGTVLGVNGYVLLKKSAWRLPYNTKFKDVAVPIPTFTKKDYKEIARLMVNSKFLEIPKYDLTDSVHYKEVLENFRGKLGGELRDYFGDYINVGSNETTLSVLYEMKRQKVEYATVLENDYPIGIITLKTIFSKIIFPKKKPRFGERLDDYKKILKLPIKDFVEEITPLEVKNINDAMKKFLMNNLREYERYD